MTLSKKNMTIHPILRNVVFMKNPEDPYTSLMLTKSYTKPRWLVYSEQSLDRTSNNNDIKHLFLLCIT